MHGLCLGTHAGYAEICDHIVATRPAVQCRAWQRKASTWCSVANAKNATLGILASQMVIRPKYVHGCLKQLWRYIVGTRELDMTSFEPNDVELGELLLTLYVDASFSTRGGRSRTGIAMYLVDPIVGSESLVQWASRRQTSMATSAPEAEVSAMAEGFAASIFLFDSLKDLKLVKGIGPSCILSMKTDSAVALEQLNAQSVTVRSRTAAQKLTYLRELVYQAPQVEPIYIFRNNLRGQMVRRRFCQDNFLGKHSVILILFHMLSLESRCVIIHSSLRNLSLFRRTVNPPTHQTMDVLKFRRGKGLEEEGVGS